MVVLLKTTSVRVIFIQIMQIRVQNKGKRVRKSRYVGDVSKIGLPKMRGLLVMTMASISTSRREVPPAESLRRRAKVLLPKFRLEMAAFRPEIPLHIFSRSKDLKYQKMGTGGGLG